MASTEHSVHLVKAAASGSTSEVEVALGRFKGDAAVAAAKQAADAALKAGRWDNLSYLADFLGDVTVLRLAVGGDGDDGNGDDCGCITVTVPEEVFAKGVFDCVVSVTGRKPDEVSPDETSEEDLSKIASCVADNILSYAVATAAPKLNEGPKKKEPMSAPPSTTAETGAGENIDIMAQVVMKAEEVEFEMIDPDAKEGDYRSAADPSPYVSVADPTQAIEWMTDANAKVIDRARIRVLYNYPFGESGPSDPEKEAGGWIFEEVAPNGEFFTRADLARAVSARYNAIYAEENMTSDVEPQFIPGMLNRAPTDGKYKIWGHVIGDLDLHTVSHDAGRDLYTLGIDS